MLGYYDSQVFQCGKCFGPAIGKWPRPTHQVEKHTRDKDALVLLKFDEFIEQEYVHVVGSLFFCHFPIDGDNE